MAITKSSKNATLVGNQKCLVWRGPQPVTFPFQDRLAETDVGVQTDKDCWPPIVVAKQVPDVYGVDKSTQILPDDPDLFVFDEEVVVVLEALVGKTLEQGLLEVQFYLKFKVFAWTLIWMELI